MTNNKNTPQNLEVVEEGKEVYQSIVDNLSEGIILTNLGGFISFVNERMCELTGYSRKELIGKNVSKMLIPSEKHALATHYKKRFLQGVEEKIILDQKHKDGSTWKGQIKVSPIKNTAGELTGALALIMNVSEQVAIEKELIDAKQVAEQAQAAEQQFLANMSHEIRTPMNAVIGMTHLLYETKPTSEQKEYLDSLRFSADSLLGILNNILDLSKIEAGELFLEKLPFDLFDLLKNLQQTFQFKVREKPVSVVFDCDSKIKNLLIGDAVRLNQILTNLMGNASKFTQRGTIGVKAKVVIETEDQYIIQFQIYDTGIGIDEDKVQLIFKNFKQADIAVHRKFGGTGLGLAIVKQLVEIQGGSIEVTSKSGVGSTFTVNLAYEKSKTLITEKPVENVPDATPIEFLDSMEVLVVEDNPMNQKLVKRILELWKCNYEIAENGVQGVAMSRQKKYAIILMDIHMPEMDGVEATTAIRAEQDNINQATPIIALTAAALLDEKDRALNSGMNDFLTKPFSPAQLQKVILKWTNLDEAISIKPKALAVSTTQSNKVLIDLSGLQRISKGDTLFINDMINIFLKEMPNATNKMIADFEQKDFQGISDTAHRIKSNFMMMGMKEQQQMALSIEKMIKTNNIDEELINNFLVQLKKDTDQAQPFLLEMLK